MTYNNFGINYIEEQLHLRHTVYIYFLKVFFLNEKLEKSWVIQEVGKREISFDELFKSQLQWTMRNIY